MKTIRYTLLILLACLSLNSCQDVEEPANTVPTVVTDAVEKYSGEFAYLSGTVSSRAECYFLISTSEDMSDAQKLEAYSYKNEEKGNWSCNRELGDLIPGTTYYVVLCATDGRSVVKGNVVSFTTSAYLSIESVKVDGKDYSWDLLGTYLTDADQYVNNPKYYGNMQTVRSGNNGYKLPHSIILTEPSYRVYAYAPYNEGNSVETINEIEVQAGGTDYLYGSCEVTPSNPKANIEMQSALAGLHFTISTDSKESISMSYINLRNVNGESKTEALSIRGKLDLATGKITPVPIPGHDGILINMPNTTIHAGVQANAEMRVIPTSFKDGEIEINISVNNELVRATLPAGNWEAGKTYEIPLKVNVETNTNMAKIGDYYYSDGTWSTKYDATKNAIGIVFALSEEKNGAINPNLDKALHGRIAALKDINGTFAWSTEIKDTYFTNFSLLDGKSAYGEFPYDGKTFTNKTLPYGIYEWPVGFGEKYALTDYTGFNNMDVIGNLYPAINAAHSYQNNINWYLPALGELARLGMACAAGLLPTDAQLAGWTYWSSTECTNTAAWVYSVWAGTNHNHVVASCDKPVQCHVRPVASF